MAVLTQIAQRVSILLKFLIFAVSTRPGGKRTIPSSSRGFLLVAKQVIRSFSTAKRHNLVCFRSAKLCRVSDLLTISKGIDFFKHAVLNDTNWDYATMNGSTVALADAINPGGINAYDPDLRPFQQKGGKVIEYHGYQDPVIPSKASPTWYDTVRGFYSGLGKTEEVEDFYRLFMVPGMRHCNGGDGGKFCFGSPHV